MTDTVTIRRDVLEQLVREHWSNPQSKFSEPMEVVRAALAASVQGEAVEVDRGKRRICHACATWPRQQVCPVCDGNTPPQPAEVGELASDLKFLADYVWRECCGLSLPNYQALGRFPLDVAEAALAKLEGKA